MGYYTRFQLEVVIPEEFYVEKLTDLDINLLFRFERLYYDSGLDAFVSSGEIKWYEHEEDLKTLSLSERDFLFILTGIGENPGDLWVKYFKNGYMEKYKAKITYPEFQGAAKTGA